MQSITISRLPQWGRARVVTKSVWHGEIQKALKLGTAAPLKSQKPESIRLEMYLKFFDLDKDGKQQADLSLPILKLDNDLIIQLDELTPKKKTETETAGTSFLPPVQQVAPLFERDQQVFVPLLLQPAD